MSSPKRRIETDVSGMKRDGIYDADLMRLIWRSCDGLGHEVGFLTLTDAIILFADA